MVVQTGNGFQTLIARIDVVPINVVSDFLRRSTEAAAARLINAERIGDLRDEDVAELASGLARSGNQLPSDPSAADLASTGGPTSLSTLLCPLYLRARGLRVPKLAVAGRPAGGVDVLQTIPGYNAGLEPRAARAALERFGYIHLIADANWAPLDAQLFAYRQRVGAQAVPAFVIASILSKKLAVGVVGAGLEVRVAPHGNFGGERMMAIANAKRYRVVAELLDLQPVTVLTDATRPFQPYIGRGEALLALEEVFSGHASCWLADHKELCRRMADEVALAMGVDAANPVEDDALRRVHEALLVAHGAAVSTYHERVQELHSTPRVVYGADSRGVAHYDVARLRDLLVSRQRAEGPRRDRTPPDPAGVILAARPGERVERGTALISVRAPVGETDFADTLGSCAWVSDADGLEARRDNDFEIV